MAADQIAPIDLGSGRRVTTETALVYVAARQAILASAVLAAVGILGRLGGELDSGRGTGRFTSTVVTLSPSQHICPTRRCVLTQPV